MFYFDFEMMHVPSLIQDSSEPNLGVDGSPCMHANVSEMLGHIVSTYARTVHCLHNKSTDKITNRSQHSTVSVFSVRAECDCMN